MYGAANRDPQEFPEPDKFDPERRDREHAGWGSGIHVCFGGPLARLEVNTAFEAFLRRVDIRGSSRTRLRSASAMCSAVHGICSSTSTRSDLRKCSSEGVPVRRLASAAECRDVAVPEPGPGQVVVKGGGAGACHSDLHILQMPKPEGKPPFAVPFTLRHENAGWVEKLGPGTTEFVPGDPVIV